MVITLVEYEEGCIVRLGLDLRGNISLQVRIMPAAYPLNLFRPANFRYFKHPNDINIRFICNETYWVT
jgi:hypothetical protein